MPKSIGGLQLGLVHQANVLKLYYCECSQNWHFLKSLSTLRSSCRTFTNSILYVGGSKGHGRIKCSKMSRLSWEEKQESLRRPFCQCGVMTLYSVCTASQTSLIVIDRSELCGSIVGNWSAPYKPNCFIRTCWISVFLENWFHP